MLPKYTFFVSKKKTNQKTDLICELFLASGNQKSMCPTQKALQLKLTRQLTIRKFNTIYSV